MRVLAAKAPDGTPGLLVTPAASYAQNVADDLAYRDALESAPFWIEVEEGTTRRAER